MRTISYQDKLLFMWILILSSLTYTLYCLWFCSQMLAISIVVLFGIIFLFTFKKRGRGRSRKFIIINDNLGMARKNNRIKFIKKKIDDSKEPLEPQSDVRHIRATTLMIVFLIFLPMVFSISSLVAIEEPEFEFALVTPDQRLSGQRVDYEELKYFSNPNDAGDLRFNSKIITKCTLSPSWGQSARVSITLAPDEVPKIEGIELEDTYEIYSKILQGPQTNRSFYIKANFGELGLIPGKYLGTFNYYTSDGFNVRAIEPKVHKIYLSKDYLTIVPNNQFYLRKGIDTGIAYTLENRQGNYWSVIYSGRVFNSLREPVETTLDCYFEIQNCTVFGASESAIYILNSNNGTLFNNTVKESKNGLNLEISIEKFDIYIFNG